MQIFRDQNKIHEFLNELLSKRESEDLEFKHASGGFSGNFWDTYSAFANTEGGTIVFGVVEKDDKLYLDPIEDEMVEKYRKEFWSNVNNKSTVSCNLLKNDDVETVKFNGTTSCCFTFLMPAGNNGRCSERQTLIMGRLKGTMRATTSVPRKRCSGCLPMPTCQNRQTAEY